MLKKMKRGESAASRAAAGAWPCRSRASMAVLAALGMVISLGAHAQSLATQAASGTAAPTESTVINLINLLVKQGVLTRASASGLIAEAQNEAAQATQARAARPAVANGATEPGDVAVPYVPQVVRDQIRDQVKQEVIAQAKAENWATPNTFPDWVSRIHITGDTRVRDEFHFFSNRNANDFTDFAAINAAGGHDFNTNTNNTAPPTLNTTQDRSNLARVRARLGIEATISDQFTTGMQLATGSSDGPVSTTQTLGGGLAKNDVWMNQIYIKYAPTAWLNITAGRFDNPFFSSDLLYSNDLEFDGISASFRKPLPIAPAVTLFGTVGAFPINYSSDSFPSDAVGKASSNTEWMLGAQFGAEWKIDSVNKVKGAIAYYDFQNVKGQLSSPCEMYAGVTSCSTDDDAPAFMQKGNTLIELRNLAQNPTVAPGLTPDSQLFGLAFNYRLFDVKAQWDTKIVNTKLRLDGEYVRNLAYNENSAFSAASTPVNNANGDTVTQSDFTSGPNGFMAKATIGEPEVHNKGDWNVSLTYKYLQPDAVLDAFTDPDFNLGGTNAKGYIVGVQYAVARDAWLSARWLAAREIYGAPLTINVLQLELDAKF